MELMNTKLRFFQLFFLSLSSWALFFAYSYFLPTQKPLDLSHVSKTITFIDNDLVFSTNTTADTVEEFLMAQHIHIDDQDIVFPEKNTFLFSGSCIILNRALSSLITVDGKKIKNTSTTKTVSGILEENAISLGRLDLVSPPLYTQISLDNNIIAITRINIEEKVVNEEIAYKTMHKTDSQLGWREEKTEQKGEKGTREVTYKITYKDNKEISRIVLEKKTTKEPMDAILVKGTYMQLGKSTKGQGTWYAFKGGLFAASTSIPRGSFARVTNTANGKSVIVEINDYGPQGKGRIIDLDKVAFTKIASLGAGVIGVKVEQILN
jgi:uncharacterized protein YabE (DUF348 family)